MFRLLQNTQQMSFTLPTKVGIQNNKELVLIFRREATCF